MRAVIHSLRGENGSLRGLTGQGEPGLWTLLGGTGGELDADGYSIGGGPGQVSAVSRVARAQNDVRVAGVASGTIPNTGPVTNPPPVRPPFRPVA